VSYECSDEDETCQPVEGDSGTYTTQAACDANCKPQTTTVHTWKALGEYIDLQQALSDVTYTLAADFEMGEFGYDDVIRFGNITVRIESETGMTVLDGSKEGSKALSGFFMVIGGTLFVTGLSFKHSSYNGAINIQPGGCGHITNCIFEDTNCTGTNNPAPRPAEGGAITVKNMMGVLVPVTTITNCSFVKPKFSVSAGGYTDVFNVFSGNYSFNCPKGFIGKPVYANQSYDRYAAGELPPSKEVVHCSTAA
jgi:hypothetical protein